MPKPETTKKSAENVKSLVIVESPAKAKTTKNYLGKNFEVLASIGHIKDLPAKKLGVDVEQNFKAEYQIIPGKKKLVSELKSQAKKFDRILLAPDPDREGEAIAWHIYEILQKANNEIYRIKFHEITKNAVRDAVGKPEKLNRDLYESQQARRILDRIVGYQISPLLWKKVQKGLSAGRVQSVCVRMVVEREEEIKNFIPEEYWELLVELKTDKGELFTAKLAGGKITNKEQMDKVLSEIDGNPYLIKDIQKKLRETKPPAPFITSTLQQDASSKLRFTPDRTMRVAQSLYEGVDLGSNMGRQGLITYMRTDSTRVSPAAIGASRNYIEKTFGKEYLPKAGRQWGKNKKGAQDAHEAIRPTEVDLSPENLKSALSNDQFRLYDLIFRRFISCQMAPAKHNQTSVTIDNNGNKFKANGSVRVFDGFRRVLGAGVKDHELPAMDEDTDLSLIKQSPEQKFTQPPPRFTPSSLIKEMEDKGIGRPSTYASIVLIIQKKNYVEKKEEKFYPTELGIIVTKLLIDNFPTIMSIDFTAKMEESLDQVEHGEVSYLKLLNKFYSPFKIDLEKAAEGMVNLKMTKEETDIDCPKCKQKLVVRWGKNGKFLACGSYPDCKFSAEVDKDKNGKVILKKEEVFSEKCEKCSSDLVLRKSKTGARFWGCSNYPNCRNIISFSYNVKCPNESCEKGILAEKASKRGKVFAACNQFPNCNFASWNKPLNEPCPNCSAPTTFLKANKKGSSKNCEICKGSFPLEN